MRHGKGVQNRLRAEEGFALIFALFTLIMALGIVVSGTIQIAAHKKKSEIDFARYAQATTVARSGLTEALGWFRKQHVQPVQKFEPVIDLLWPQPLLDTEDPDIGIVREFPITGAYWGRYEVWKEWAADPDADRLAWREKIKAKDISSYVPRAPNGGVWLLRSVGFVYHKRDDSKAFNEQPNRVVATEMLEVEIQRTTVIPPAAAALSARRGTNVLVNTNGRVDGGQKGTGVYYPTGTGTPHQGGGGTQRITGAPSLAPDPNYDDSIPAVFGVSEDTLKAAAHYVVSDPADLPTPLPDDVIIFIENPSIHFDATHPLTSNAAIVVCKGQVVVESGSNSHFKGMLYIEGKLTLRGNAEIYGAVVATDGTTIQSAQGTALIHYDDGVLERLRGQASNYRMTSAFRKPRT